MSKHTKGPWMLGKPYGHTRVEIVGNEGNRMVASVVDTRAKYNPATDKTEQVQCPEGEANARLIAAAPEMYALLESIYESLPFGEWQNTKESIWDLLCKARGE